MRKLIEFILQYSQWLLYILYTIIGFVLLFQANTYQRSKYLLAANTTVGVLYEATGEVASYIGLREINQSLIKRSGELEAEVLSLRGQIARSQYDSLQRHLTVVDTSGFQYRYIVSQVVNNSITRRQNYITIDRGAADGVTPDMGVVTSDGVVGIVSAVSPHYAVVISLLNTKMRLSCKVKGSDYFGTLVWRGQKARYATLEELPRHVRFSVGDTIVTSGYSSIFPPDIIVGRISDFSEQCNTNFFSLDIELSTDFTRLNDVHVISNKDYTERKELEENTLAK